MTTPTGTPVKSIIVTVSTNNASVELEVDTGASGLIISKIIIMVTRRCSPVKESNVKLQTQIDVMDSTTVTIKYKAQTEQ